jgi:hypothetical protein
VFSQNTGAGTAPHEVGHLLGLTHNDVQQVGPKGNKAPDKKNLMTPIKFERAPGARPTAKQIHKIVREHGESDSKK